MITLHLFLFQAKSDAQLAIDAEGLTVERVWLIHKGGFASARLLKLDGGSALPDGKCRITLDHGAEVLDVDEEDVEKVNLLIQSIVRTFINSESFIYWQRISSQLIEF